MPDQTVVLLREELRAEIADTLEVDVAALTDDAVFTDEFDVDSLMAMEIVVRLEKKYGVAMDESELRQVTTFQATYDLVAEKLRARP